MINSIIDDFPSPLRYPGGKTRLATFLTKAIGKNYCPNDKLVFVEPYAGGAGASLTLLQTGIVDRIILNDLDPAIYAFWNIAVSNTEYLIRKIRRVQISIEEWHIQRAIYLNPKSSKKKLAFATLFLNRTNRSGIIGGRPIGGLTQNGNWKIGARFNKSTIIGRLRNIERLQHKISVSNHDGIHFLVNIENDSKSSKHLVFLDPPYYEQGDSLYLNDYKIDDHLSLADFLSQSKLNWIMTYDDSMFVRELYSGYFKRKFTINHSAQRHKKGREVVLFCNSLFHVYP